MTYGRNILKMKKLVHKKFKILDKLLSLTERVSYSSLDNTKDLMWCKKLRAEVRDDDLPLTKEEIIMANLMWKKYNDNGGVEPTNENMWELIDALLTQENPSKIGAIKMYRRFTNSNLRDAKDMVDAREIKIQKGW